MASTPVIFSPSRRLAARARAHRLQALPGAPRYLHEDMVDDVIDRLAFLRHEPRRVLVIGDWTRTLAPSLTAQGAAVIERDPLGGAVEPIDEEQPYPETGFDFIASLGTLDTVNDLPGALIHLRNALAPGGLMIASFPGAGSLETLRGVMFDADGERPAPRVHPQVDVRAGGQLLQRCGFADPVIDTRTITVRFASLDSLVADLRAQGLGNVLARSGPPLGKAALTAARNAFARAGSEGRTTERFEILTLSGWRR
ncbi:methyltransferase domain-containing protein [Novosphingobium sp.]|uniref:methyltransferase domain-containing protein n=1 Tax=Novosphingobium sp. TaxID=1874826 RepID=UPI0025E9185A|nr:methyltransferase domain-containing protein [Novosphingobium sp.]